MSICMLAKAGGFNCVSVMATELVTGPQVPLGSVATLVNTPASVPDGILGSLMEARIDVEILRSVAPLIGEPF